MTRFTRLCRAVGVGLAVAAATLSMTQIAHAGPTPPTVPSNLVPKSGNKVYLVGQVLNGGGVQIYKCVGTGWVFDAPSATLVADNGKTIITHGRGPTWTARDGSSVVAERVDGVTVDKTAVPWLLLKATKTTVGPDGDRLAHTTFIQRINTTGGVAPNGGVCDPKVDKEAQVPYTADYYFWKATAGG